MEAIEIAGLAKRFRGKRGKEVVAVADLTLSVKTGEVFGFLGPNGAGKSTTIKMLAGLVAPSSGNAKIFGVPVSDPLSRKKIGYLPENPAFYDFLTGEECLWFVGKTFGLKGNHLKHETDRVLKLLDLDGARTRPVRTYSKGMVQRLGLAQALVHDPDLFILDEPMSGLDPVGRALVKDIITDLRVAGKSVFFSTHILSDVETICDRVGIISKGILRTVENVEMITVEGISGYTIRYRDRSNSVCECRVDKSEITSFASNLASAGGEIVYIEPQRYSLEKLFLELIK